MNTQTNIPLREFFAAMASEQDIQEAIKGIPYTPRAGGALPDRLRQLARYRHADQMMSLSVHSPANQPSDIDDVLCLIIEKFDEYARALDETAKHDRDPETRLRADIAAKAWRTASGEVLLLRCREW